MFLLTRELTEFNMLESSFGILSHSVSFCIFIIYLEVKKITNACLHVYVWRGSSLNLQKLPRCGEEELFVIGPPSVSLVW